MGSAVPDFSSQKAVEPGLIDVGKKLFRCPSSTDELIILLEKAESLLAKVWQQPPRSTCGALLPIMKALIKNELLSHYDVNVRVALASCFNELTRITAPDFPYGDDKMRVIFRLFMVAFENLSGESGCNYYRALQIVETMAKVRSALMLLDVDKDNLVVEMFRLFLKNIKANHPSDIFKYKEMIITLVIEEIDEISFELLTPLLASVKMRNKVAKPISWVLGTKVFEKCATRLQPHLRDIVKAWSLELNDYAEIVALICNDTLKERNLFSNLVSKKVAPTSGDDNCAPQTNDGTATNLDDENRTLRRRRARKSNSVMRSDEGYEHTQKSGGRFSNEASPDGYNEEKDDIGLPSDLVNSSILSNSSQKRVEFLSLHKKVQSKNNQQKDLQLPSTSKRKLLSSKEKDYNVPMKKGKASGGASEIRMENKEGIPGEKREFSHQEPNRKKQMISQKYVREDDAEKTEDFLISRPAITKSEGKEKKSRRSWFGNGAELVDIRIQVWWPKDKVFYPGTVKAFNPETKKHTILYDDDEIEVLNLRKETWNKLSDEGLPQNLEADTSSPPREPIRIKENIAKRKSATSKKLNAASSSKRSKDENRSISKSGDASSPRHVDGPEDAESNDILQNATKG